MRARGFSARDLAGRSDVAQGRIEAALNQEGELTADEVNRIADELAVPIPALFVRRAPELAEAVDFRRVDPAPRAHSRKTLEAFAYAEKISAALSDLDVDLAVAPDASSDPGDFSKRRAAELAAEWRQRWGLSIEDQLELRDANRLYADFRSFVEGLGLVVQHRSFGTTDIAGIYTQVGDGPHIVLINTTGSSKARKLFTLAHEFCHFLIRAEGASNPSIIRNRIERFCNYFAALLLAPSELIRIAVERYGRVVSNDNDYIRLFAGRIGISQEATIRRLVEVGYLTGASYRAWRARFEGRIPPGDSTDGGGGPTDPLQTKITQYGRRFLGLLAEAKRNDEIDEIEVYRLCGLRPRFQRQLLAA